jgi:hypothetical protein
LVSRRLLFHAFRESRKHKLERRTSVEFHGRVQE